LASLMKQSIDSYRQQLTALNKHLLSLHPKKVLQNQLQHVDFLQQTLIQLIRLKLQTYRQELATNAGRLNTLSPLKTLSRGYSISIDLNQNQAVTSILNIKTGDTLLTKLADGDILSTIESIQNRSVY